MVGSLCATTKPCTVMNSKKHSNIVGLCIIVGSLSNVHSFAARSRHSCTLPVALMFFVVPKSEMGIFLQHNNLLLKLHSL